MYTNFYMKMEWHFLVGWMVFSSLSVLADPTLLKKGIEIYSLHVDCKVTSRFAHTVITSKVSNLADESKEALFEVELPKTAFITNFSMTIDGHSYPGIIKEKKSAQDQYNAAVSRGQSAGLVKSTGRKLEQFHVSVNVAPLAKVTFELIYEELLKRKLGKYELLIKVNPKQLVKHFQIDTHIFEPQGISSLETESTFMTNELNDALTKVHEDTKVHISFKPTIDQQRKNPELEETLLDGDFLIRYDVKRNLAAGDVQIVNGYFVHYFAPKQMPAFPKNIIFVIDKSGSMSGKKIQQTREALEKILGDLNPEDYFNLVVFSASIVEWQSTLLQAREENVELAKQYVRTIFAGGGTDINGALLTAINSLDNANSAELLPEPSISMIILLTDGQPTVGESNINNIQENVKTANNGKYNLYCLGFGFDVSYSFLEKMALNNGGVARRIYEDSDAALQLQDFYQEVATPILKRIEMKYSPSAVQEVTQNNFNVMYEGSEIVVAGKLGEDIALFPVEIEAQANGFKLALQKDENVMEKEQVFQNQKYIFGDFIERLWAYLTIQQLLEKLVSAKGQEQKNLEAQALNLSLKFSFVTPLTSMVVTKPNAQDVADKPTEADNENIADAGDAFRIMDFSATSLFRGEKGLPGPPGHRHGLPGLVAHPFLKLPDVSYESGVIMASVRDVSLSSNPVRRITNSRGGKERSMRQKFPVIFSRTSERDNVSYPHFILQLPRENETICIEISGEIQASLILLSDPDKGIHVSGRFGKSRQFVDFEIVYQKLAVRITVSTQGIVLLHNGNRTILPWTSSISFAVPGLNIIVEKERSLSLLGPGNFTVKISYVKLPEHFLGLYITDGANFSDQVTGLLGQFYFNTHFEGNSRHRRRDSIIVQGKTYNAIRENRKDYRVESSVTTVSCWSLTLNP